ncbi:MAG: pilus assembly protein PilM [Candidatus Pacebacteria bacterium]|nr:pilus assembly protein PilM [Candidatus Paceibacterota bacterium]
MVTRTVVLSWPKDASTPDVITSVATPTKGVRHGYIVNLPDAVSSIRRSVELAEKESGITIKRAIFSIGGTSLSAENSNGSAIISKSDGEVSNFDIKTALTQAEEAIELKNRKIIFSSPVSWKLDGKDVPGKPEGMHGVKLEVKILSITCLAQHLDDLLSAAAEAGVEVVDVVPSSVAASEIALTDRQRAVGVMLVNIGAETVSIAIFENGVLIGFSVFPIGSTDITNDIALGFRITLEEAESIKTGSIMATSYPKRKVDDIIEARLSDIFELIDGYLKKIKRSGLLPAGVVITGGGAGHALVEGLAKDMLRLPSRVGAQELLSNMKGPVRDSSWFVSYGLAILGKENGESPRGKGGGGSAKGIFKEFLRQFLP